MSGIIYILTGPVRHGKTTHLFHWTTVADRSIGGFLCPDLGGKRMLYDVFNRRYHPFEVRASYRGETVRVGRFCFSQAGFDLAHVMIDEAIRKKTDWIVLDEIGLLESKNLGFASCLEKVLRLQKSHAYLGDLLLVIRLSCFQDIISQFGIEMYHRLTVDHLLRSPSEWKSV